ncbi:MAG: Rieske (2Fe-2S) protein [Pseudomonadota bacterium]
MTTQPVGLSYNLAPRQVMRATVGEFDMAVWRSTSGVVSAWDNRCPHRGMRLSYGFVRGESLACAYHGWHYSCEGYCHYIPAHPELTPPKTVRPVMHSVREYGGIIWVNPAGNTAGDMASDATNDATPVTLPGNPQPLRSLAINGPLDSALQALANVPAADAGEFQVQTLSESPRVLSLSAAAFSDQLYVALQASQPDRTIAHVVTGNAMTTDQRVSLSRWLEAIRRSAESMQGTMA